METASRREMTWEASLEGESEERTDGGQVLREKPGMSKVVIVKCGDRRWRSAAKGWVSPSAEGRRTRSGPSPQRRQCQRVPSGVGIFNLVRSGIAVL